MKRAVLVAMRMLRLRGCLSWERMWVARWCPRYKRSAEWRGVIVVLMVVVEVTRISSSERCCFMVCRV